MRILLIGNYALDKQESMLRFAALLHRELELRKHEVTVLQPPPYFGRICSSAQSGLGKWLAYIDKFILFPLRLRFKNKDFDVVHVCDHSNSMYVKHLKRVPHLVTCHDVLAIRSALGEIPQNTASFTGRKFQELILTGLKAAQLVVCVSENTRTELLRIAGRSPTTTTLAYLSLNYPYSPMDRSEALARLDKLRFDGRRQFFVHVGGTNWYKNRIGVLQIFQQLKILLRPKQPYLLMIGKPLSERHIEYIRENGLENAVKSLSNLSNENLRAAYSLADGLIFPSLQEGFGWPILEAQACGCPVFTTGRAPMNEVGHTSAVYFDPSDTTKAAQIIAEGLEESDSMRLGGLDNVLRFSNEKMIQRYLDAYDSVIKCSTSSRRHHSQ